MAFFPLFVDLKEKSVLVIGGGAVAERRVCSLLDFGCKIVVTAPEVTEKLEMLSKSGKIVWKQEVYSKNDIMGCFSGEKDAQWFFVLAAADDSVNARVVKDCKEAGISVNNASRKEDCDFYFPGLIKEQEVVIGVTSSGSDHKLVAALSKRIRELVQKTWQV